MRKDTGVDGDAQRLSQIVWMLFLKIFADKEEEAEVMSDDYTSPLEEKYRWQTWAKDDEGMTGDELIDFINNDLFPYLQNLENDSDKRAFIIKNIFQDTYNYMKSGTLLRQVINKINEKEIEIDGFCKAKKYTIQEIKERNYNLDLCGYPYEEEEVLEPMELLKQYQEKRAKLDANIDNILSQIKTMIGEK